MKNVPVFLIAVFAMFLMSLGPLAAADKGAWLDATHYFQPLVEKLVKDVERETRMEHARRHRAPLPALKQYQVGDVETFWTKNVAEDTYEQTPATLKAIGEHCYIFVENGKSVPDSAIEKIRTSFDSKVYPIDTESFGSEWKPGVDGDERITLLMLDIKDGYTPNSNKGYIGGYFFAGDEFLQAQIPAQYKVKSNEREMFYLDIYPSDPTDDGYMSTVAHEFQHMIHFNLDANEFTWVNECCSQIAPYLCGFGHAEQIKSYMQSPDNSLTAWSEEHPVANYGQVYLWGYYLMSRYLTTDTARRTFFKNLVADQARGYVGFDNAIAQFGTGFTSSFTEFMIANFINNKKLDKGQYAYDDSLGKFRLPVTETVSVLPAEIRNQVFLWSADALKVDLSKIHTPVTVDFTGGNMNVFGYKKNEFVVASVLSSSRDRNAPKIEFMKLKKTEDWKSLTGSLDIAPDAAFDTLSIIVLSQGPGGIADEEYASFGAIPYTVKLTDKGVSGSPIVRGRRTVHTDEMIAAYSMAAESLTDPKTAEQACAVLDGITSELTSAVAADLEAGDVTTVDEFIASAATTNNRTALRPLAARLADQLGFIASQDPSKDVSSRIDTLKNF